MNQMEIFKNPEFGSVRVIEENGKYLFWDMPAPMRPSLSVVRVR